MAWQERLDIIAKDSVHGASFLTKQAIQTLLTIQSKDELIKAAKKLQQIQPCMASLYNLGSFILQHIDTINSSKLTAWLQNFEMQNKKAAQKAAKVIENRHILTHSYSSAVYEAIRLACPKKIICTESRPHNEGVALAKKLYNEGFVVELVSDAAAAIMVKEVDIVLFGADGIAEFGLVHKVGSFAIALAANYYQKELITIAPKSKWWPKGYTLPKEQLRDPKELGCVCAKNFYFDLTPLSLITTIIN